MSFIPPGSLEGVTNLEAEDAFEPGIDIRITTHFSTHFSKVEENWTGY